MKFHSSAALIFALLLASQPYDAKAINHGVRGGARNMISSSNITDSGDWEYNVTADNEESSFTPSLNDCSPPKESSPIHVGCYKQYFKTETEVKAAPFTISKASNLDHAADICKREKCKTDRFIGVQRSKTQDGRRQFICYCLTQPSNNPDASLLSYGDCITQNNVENIPNKDKMDLFFIPSATTQGGCNKNESFEEMAGKLDKIKLSYDIIKNEMKPSPFESYMDGCGSTMYKVLPYERTDILVYDTRVTTLQEYNEELRETASLNIAAEAKVKVNATELGAIAGSYDEKRQKSSEKSWKQYSDNRVFSLEAQIQKGYIQYAASHHSVFLSKSFMDNYLKPYSASGFATDKADNILREFGHFIVKEALFGGTNSQDTTISRCQYYSSDIDESSLEQCFQLGISALLKKLIGVSLEVGTCSEEYQKKLESLFQSSSTFESEAVTIGGTLSEQGRLVVTPESATLLPEGQKFILLSDVLKGKMISPLTMWALRWKEKDFDEVQKNLEAHILKRLREAYNALEKCGVQNKPVFFHNFKYSDEEPQCETISSECKRITKMYGIRSKEVINGKIGYSFSDKYGAADHWDWWLGNWNNPGWKPNVSHVEKIVIYKGGWRPCCDVIRAIEVTYRLNDGILHRETFGKTDGFKDKLEMEFGNNDTPTGLCPLNGYLAKIEIWYGAMIDKIQLTDSNGIVKSIGTDTSNPRYEKMEIAKDGSERFSGFEFRVDNTDKTKGFVRDIGAYVARSGTYDCSL